ATWHALERATAYCRVERRPFLLEARVSRLHGHSSSSGAARNQVEPDCVELFERKLLAAGVLVPEAVEQIRLAARQEADAAVEAAMKDPRPTPADVERFTYAPSPVD